MPSDRAFSAGSYTKYTADYVPPISTFLPPYPAKRPAPKTPPTRHPGTISTKTCPLLEKPGKLGKLGKPKREFPSFREFLESWMGRMGNTLWIWRNRGNWGNWRNWGSRIGCIARRVSFFLFWRNWGNRGNRGNRGNVSHVGRSQKPQEIVHGMFRGAERFLLVFVVQRQRLRVHPRGNQLHPQHVRLSLHRNRGNRGNRGNW